MLYLFNEENGENSFIYYESNVISSDRSSEIFNWLNSMDDFKSGHIYGQEISRLQKWYQSDKQYFSNEWIKEYDRWKSHDYCDQLLYYQSIIQDITNNICRKNNIKIPKINSCLINKYKNGENIIKKHSDNQTTFGDNPTVSILSVGQARTMYFTRRKHNPGNIRYFELDDETKHLNMSIKLEHGSILIMGGATQKYFCHSIEKEDTLNTRYSITCREYIK